MIDLFLRTETEEEMIEALKPIEDLRGCSIDMIGNIINSPATYDEEGNELTEQIYYEGFHTNIRCSEEIAETIPDNIKIEVENPKRVFNG